jgi:succinyl-CoA synthetase alpha subunit
VSILVNASTRVLCQGITGKAGAFHAGQCLEYGSRLVAGVTPGKGGSLFRDQVPVYDTVEEAVRRQGAEATMIFVPAPVAGNAIQEAARAGIKLIVCITEGIPQQDMVAARRMALSCGATLIGPNCPGIITPGECKIGIMPGYIHRKGSIGLISRSGTLTYEAVWQITSLGLGQSTCIGMGGDPIHGVGFIELLSLFQADPDTEAVVMIGEIGGSDEEKAAEWLAEKAAKPVVAFIAGRSAPPGRRMGHAGAIISGSSGTANGKIDKLEEAGVTVCRDPSEIGKAVLRVIGEKGMERKRKEAQS